MKKLAIIVFTGIVLFSALTVPQVQASDRYGKAAIRVCNMQETRVDCHIGTGFCVVSPCSQGVKPIF